MAKADKQRAGGEGDGLTRPGVVILMMQRAIRRFEQRLVELMSSRGFDDIRPAYTTVLRNIGPAGARITDIARRAGMTKQAIGVLVATLEERGVVERVPDPADGRARLVRMTESAAQRNVEVLELIASIDREYAKLLGAADYAELKRIMRRLVDWR